LERGPLVQRLVSGDLHGEALAATVSDFTAAHLGAAVAAVEFTTVSVGVVFGLALTDGRRVIVKAHQPRQRRDFLETVHRVQRHLHGHGFPAPAPLLGPRPLGAGLAVAEELVDAGAYRAPHAPRIRRTTAAALAEVIELARPCGRPDGLRHGWRLLSNRDGLWPAEAHDPQFDLEATAEGAEWIDELAAKARAVLDAVDDEPIVGHEDWSAKHFRFLDDDTIGVVYDWDSLTLDTETKIVSTAAATFTANWDLRPRIVVAPSPDEVRGFVEDYFDARGRPVRRSEREALMAAACFVACYTARCERAGGWVGDFTNVLQAHGASYLVP